MATVMLTIRVPERLRDDFTALAEANDLTVSQILRAVMREYVDGRRTLNPISGQSSTPPAIPATTRAENKTASIFTIPASIPMPQEKQAKATKSEVHDDADFMAGVKNMLGMDDE